MVWVKKDDQAASMHHIISRKAQSSAVLNEFGQTGVLGMTSGSKMEE